jgi:hypothetical protein
MRSCSRPQKGRRKKSWAIHERTYSPYRRKRKRDGFGTPRVREPYVRALIVFFFHRSIACARARAVDAVSIQIKPPFDGCMQVQQIFGTQVDVSATCRMPLNYGTYVHRMLIICSVRAWSRRFPTDSGGESDRNYYSTYLHTLKTWSPARTQTSFRRGIESIPTYILPLAHRV